MRVRGSAVLWLAVVSCPLAAPSQAAAVLPEMPLSEVPVTQVGPVAPTLVPAPVAQMVGGLNKTRARHGLRPLRASASLRRSATRYAEWMLRADYFGHLARIRASRRFRRLGEAIAIHRGHRPRRSMTIRMWMRSPGHRRLVLSRRFTFLGVGTARGRFRSRAATTWVLHLGR